MSTQPLPPEALALGDTPTAVLGARRPSLFGPIAAGVLTLVTGLAVNAMGAPPMIVLMFTGLMAMLSFILLVGPYFSWFPVRNLLLLVYPQGLVYIKGKDVQVICWEDIGEVWEKLTRTQLVRSGGRTQDVGISKVEYTISDKDGRIFELDNRLRDLNYDFRRDFAKGILPYSVRELGELINAEVMRIQLPQALAAVQSGDWVDFDEFSVSQQGLRSRDKTLPWGDVGSMSFEQGFLTVKKRNERSNWLRVAAWEIPNHHVMMALVQQVGNIAVS